MTEFSVSERVKLLKAIHTEASALVQEWWPDSMKFPRDRRIAEISLMQMLTALTAAEATSKLAEAIRKLIDYLAQEPPK